MTLTTNKILEWYLDGDSDTIDSSTRESVTALPDSWTKKDTEEIGIPIAIGSKEHGFVAAIVLESQTNPMQWISNRTHPTLSDALSETIANASHMKLCVQRTPTAHP